MDLCFDMVKAANERIGGKVNRTPMIRLEMLDERLGCMVYAKAECMQTTGSFKYRGALNFLLSRDKSELANGAVAVSSGNHGRAVSYAARALGVRATIVLPDTVTPLKKKNIEDLGAKTVICPSAERFEVAHRVAQETGAILIPPFDDFDIMAGQGTAGIEIAEQCPDLDAVVVPLSGGGLLSGVATAIKHISPAVRVYGAEPAVLPRYTASLKAGAPTSVPFSPTLADALISVRPGEKCFGVIRDRADGVFDVDEEHIRAAARLLTSEGKLLAEPASCIGIGAVLQGLTSFDHRQRVCFLISGGNVSVEQLAAI